MIYSTPVYYVRHNPDFKAESVKTTHYGTETVSFLGSRTWNLVPM